MIPKIIHYCWFGGKMPDSNKTIVDEWKKLLPDYSFYCWDDEHISDYNIRFVRQAFRKRHFAFVADFFRLCKLAEYGGFYLDTDMKLCKRLDDFLQYDFVISSEVPGRPNWAFFGASKGNELILQCKKQYLNLVYDEFKPPVIPYFLKDHVNQAVQNNPDTYIDLPAAYFYPLPQEYAGEDYGDFLKPETIGVHLWDFSWSVLKKERSLTNELIYRLCVLTKDLIHFDYPLYYFKINLIRIRRLIFK